MIKVWCEAGHVCKLNYSKASKGEWSCVKTDRQHVGLLTGWTDVSKDVLYLTMFLCSMLSPGLLNPNVSCMFSLILIKRCPQMSLVGLNLTRTAQ